MPCKRKGLYGLKNNYKLIKKGVDNISCGILISNGSGIAAAIDSALTLNDSKSSNGFSKIFELKKDFPIGTLIYDSSDFQSIPMETLIGKFKRHADFDKLNTIPEIKKAFCDFLADNTPEFDFNEACEDVIYDLSLELADISREGFDEFCDVSKKDIVHDFVKNHNVYNSFDEDINNLIPDFVEKQDRGRVFNLIKKHVFCDIINPVHVVLMGISEGDNFPSYTDFELLANVENIIVIGDDEEEYNIEGNFI